MTNWLTFEGRVETMVWGKSTHSILPVPPDVAGALAAAGARRIDTAKTASTRATRIAALVATLTEGSP